MTVFHFFQLYFIKKLSYYKLMFRCNFKSDFYENYMNSYKYWIVFWTKKSLEYFSEALQYTPWKLRGGKTSSNSYNLTSDMNGRNLIKMPWHIILINYTFVKLSFTYLHVHNKINVHVFNNWQNSIIIYMYYATITTNIKF